MHKLDNGNRKYHYLYKYIFFIIFIFYFIISFKTQNLIYKQCNFKEKEIIKKSKNNEYLKIEMIKKFNSFIKICKNKTLKEEDKFPLKKKPKISVIIPIYNGGKYLNYALRSIQNQRMKDLEIILIDDYSLDDSIKIIENYMKEDERIRLIKNHKNKKILYSKSIAALNSNGEYIIELDQDDIFIRDDIFEILYFEGVNHNLDLVQMRDFVKQSFFFKKITKVNHFYSHFIHPKKTHYKTQPNLKEKLFINNNNYLLWGLLIKTDLYKNTIYRLWPLIINYQITFNEDYIITFMIIILAQKYKYLNKFGLIHLMHKKCTSYGYWEKKEYYLSLYFFVYYIYNYYIKDNPQDIKIIINYIIIDPLSFNIGKKFFPYLFHYMIQLILNSDYLLFIEKKNILKKLNININRYNLINEYLINKTDYISIYNFQKLIKNKIDRRNINKKEIVEIRNNFKITIIIYCIDYKSLEITLNSIIHQMNIIYEIIIIYENNDNNILDYIKNYKDIYKNIKLINNKEPKGIMISYSIGVLSSKGDYILTLQSGHTLSNENTLLSFYNIAINNNIDILEFNLLLNNQNNINSNSFTLLTKNNNYFDLNKEFKLIKNNKDYKEIEKEVIFNKIIKSECYKFIVSKYNLNKYNETVYNYYGNILKYLFNKNNLKYIHVNIFGVIEYMNNFDRLKLKNITNNKNQKINDSIFYINFLFNNSDNIYKDKKFVLQEFINIMSIIYNRFTKLTDNSIKLFEKIVNCKYINNEDKNELKLFYKSLLN